MSKPSFSIAIDKCNYVSFKIKLPCKQMIQDMVHGSQDVLNWIKFKSFGPIFYFFSSELITDLYVFPVTLDV